MPRVRDEIVRKLWRGKDPFLALLFGDGVPDLQGWGSQHQYLTDGVQLVRPSIIVEVGVWKGASVIHMASRLRDLGIDGAVIAVDTWLGAWDHWVHEAMFRELGILEPNRGIFATFLRNVKSAHLEDYIVPLPLDSINAAQVLHHFNILPDMVHIDAGHDYAAVMADIKQWWPLLKPGGLLIGDDYRAGNDWPGVKRAFDDFFRPLSLIPLENANEKCRVIKPPMQPHTSQLWSRTVLAGPAISEWREAHRLEMVYLLETENIGVKEQLEGYVRFGGPNWEAGLIRIMDQIATKLSSSGRRYGRGDIFGADGDVRTDVVQALIPGFNAHYPRAAPTDGFEKFELLPEFDNPFARFALPPAINKNMAKVKAPALQVSRTSDASLFVTPIGYQLFRPGDGIRWAPASTRAYSQEVMECPHLTVDKSVVLVQDGFEGSNFSHFLFDWIPRLCHFLNSGIEDPLTCLFLMGGIPSEFHFHVVKAVCEIYELNQEQFIFPVKPEIWHVRGKIYFFSDLKEFTMHPANMAHRRSIAIVREVCSHISTGSGEIKRLYISRGDTRLRRIANEAELSRELRAFGFIEVQLGSIPFLEQVKLVRGADVIVAPHGMGLTHIAFHEGRPLIVELHNPVIGTDAYAFMARALGFKYHAIMGTDLGDETEHYNVNPRDVVNVLLEEGISPEPTADSGDSLRIQPRFWGGVQSVGATEVFNIAPLRPNTAVLRHTRDDATVQPDSNTGWLELAGLIDGAVYHCCCDVWIPVDFTGDKVALDCSGITIRDARPADLNNRDRWQTISIIGIAKEALVNFVLRCDAASSNVFYSSGWRSGPGSDLN